MNEFKEAKRKKERGISNKEYADLVHKELADCEASVTVIMYEDDTIETYRTSDSSLTSIGLLETAKNSILREMEE